MITRAVLFESFAGRDKELAHLVELRARSARGLRGGVVLVSGEAGIGKSRLLTEFARAPGPAHAAFLRARCEPNGASYAPLVWALQELAARRELAKRAEIEAALVALTEPDDVRDDPAAGRRRRMQALVSAIVVAARRLGQLTIAIDDAHWSDRSSLETLRALTVAARDNPIALIITYRPGDLSLDHASANAIAAIEKEGADRIRLDPLPFGEIAQLLGGLIPNASPRLLRRVYDLSEGRPYVAEELARSVIEHGDELKTTLSLRSAVLERIERLPVPMRAVIDRAAILGRNFKLEDLLALGFTAAEVFAAFRAAVDLQLLEERAVGDEPWFRFRHALTREILYNEMLGVERRDMHRAIADHLSTSSSRVAELAYHLSAAREHERATVANERAGDEASALAAVSDAASFYDAALRNARLDGPTVARLALKRATALKHAVDVEELMLAVPRDVERLEELGFRDDAMHLRIAAFRATDTTRPLVAAKILGEVNEALRADTHPNIRFSVELINARMARKTYRMQDAFEACSRAEAALQAPTDVQRSALLLSRANTHLFLNDLAPAARLLEERARYRADGAAGHIEEAEGLAVLADVLLCRGELQASLQMKLQAADVMERGRMFANAHGFRQSATLPATYIGDFAFIARQVDECLRDRIDFQDQLIVARARMARAMGTDPEPHVAAFERALAGRLPFLIEKLGADIPWMFANEPDRSRSFVKRTLSALTFDGLDGDFMEAVVRFGDDDDLARGLELYASIGPPKSDHLMQQVQDAMVRARLALREHRSIEAAQMARDAAELTKTTGQWLERAHALAILGNADEARAELNRVGATAEVDRLHRRQAQRSATPLPSLTPREEQVLRLTVGGLTSREVAERLSIAARTVEAHLQNVYEKLDVSSSKELLDYFEVPPPSP